MITKKEVSILVLLIVLVGGFVVFYDFERSEDADIRKFSGGIVSVDGQRVTMHGVFSADVVPEAFREPREFSFQADALTTFTKTEIHWNWEKLKNGGQTSGRVNLNDLPKTRTAGSLADIQSLLSSGPNNIYLEVEFAESIHNTENPVASSVFYEVIMDS